MGYRMFFVAFFTKRTCLNSRLHFKNSLKAASLSLTAIAAIFSDKKGAVETEEHERFDAPGK